VLLALAALVRAGDPAHAQEPVSAQAPANLLQDAAEGSGPAERKQGRDVRVTLGDGLTVLLPAELAARADAVVQAGGAGLAGRMRGLLRRHAADDPAQAAALGRYLAERHPAQARTVRRSVRRFTGTGGELIDAGAAGTTAAGTTPENGNGHVRTEGGALAGDTATAPRADGIGVQARGANAATIPDADSAIAASTSGGAVVGGGVPAPQDTLLSSPGVTVQALASRVASPTRP